MKVKIKTLFITGFGVILFLLLLAIINHYFLSKKIITENFVKEKYVFSYKMKSQIKNFFYDVRFEFDRHNNIIKKISSLIKENDFNKIKEYLKRVSFKDHIEFETFLVDSNLNCHNIEEKDYCNEEAKHHRYYILKIFNNEVTFTHSGCHICLDKWEVKRDFFFKFLNGRYVLVIDEILPIKDLKNKLIQFIEGIPALTDVKLIVRSNKIYLLNVKKNDISQKVYPLKEWYKIRNSVFQEVGANKYYYFEKNKLVIINKFKTLNQEFILKTAYSTKKLQEVLNSIKYRLLGIFIFLTVFIVIIYLLIAHKVSKDIVEVVKSMKENRPVENINSYILELYELKKMYNEYREKLQKEIEKNEALLEENKRFIIDTIHQIRTPLSIMTLNLDDLKFYVNDKEGKKILEEIEAALAQLSNSYEDLSYISANGILTYEAKDILNLSDHLRQRIKFFSSFARSNDIEIVTDIDDHIHYYINKVEFERIVDNNLSNAIKYSTKKSKIYVSLKRRSHFIVLKFESYGKPIKNPEKIFDKNYREHSYARGLGVGLNIVKNICEKYGIKYKVYYEEGRNVFEYIFNTGE